MCELIKKYNGVINKNVEEKREGLVPSVMFTDSMVLQRNAVNKVFGKCDYEGDVFVQLDGEIYQGCAKKGTFEVYLPSMEVKEDLVMVIYGKENKVTIKDVCVGEVFLFSGQSNMEWTMGNTICNIWPEGMIGKQFLAKNNVMPATYVPNEIDDADTYLEYEINLELGQTYVDKAEGQIEYDEYLRLMEINTGYVGGIVGKNLVPQDEYELERKWQKATNRQAILDASMFAYYFCKNVRKRLGIPVGAVIACVGATETTTWVPREVYEANKEFYIDLGNNVESHNSISTCYNTLIAPIAGFVFGTFVWYQGEGECASENYVTAFSKLVEHYKKIFCDFNTLVVALARYCMGSKFPKGYTQETFAKADKRLGMEDSASALGRNHQQLLPKYIENCAVTVNVNSGDFDDIHPTDKLQTAYQASCVYFTSFCNIKDESLVFPTLNAISRSDDGVTLSFNNLGSGLVFKNEGIGFQISEDGKEYEQVLGEKRGEQVFISASVLGGKKINYVRYGWLEFPRISRVNNEYVCIFNSFGLPLDQFNIAVEDYIKD